MMFHSKTTLLTTTIHLLIWVPRSASAWAGNSIVSRREAAVTAASSAAATISLLPTTPARAVDRSAYQPGPERLQYMITGEGTGPKPQRAQKIQTSYTLWINGFPDDESGDKKAIQIDSSRKPIVGDQPFRVRAGVKQVIRGWDLALMDMKEGESRRLIVPSSLGYGDKGVGPIPGKATLYFEMKLTKVEQPMEKLSPEAEKWMQDNPL